MSTASVPVVNTHIHTPYSFTCFSSVQEAVVLAKSQGLSALGISDFNTVEGFEEFNKLCLDAKIYPLFNIEFIALIREDKLKSLRWNDPKNPGIMYFCGKALDCPISFSGDSRNSLSALWKGTQDYIWQVIEQLNSYITSTGLDAQLDYNGIRTRFAKNTVRERHVAKALFYAFAETYTDSGARLNAYKTIFKDPAYSGAINDNVFMQNDIRDRLLKAGKPGFVEEKEEAFMDLDQVKRTILDGGGIPCYPVLADDSIGLNEHEADVAMLADTLMSQGIYAVEFIPLRNTLDHLKAYVKHFDSKGFCVTFGTEHNTPKNIPLAPKARKDVPFDDELAAIAYKGACILAAHQENRKNRSTGFVSETGERLIAPSAMNDFARIGDAIIRKTAQ